MRVLTAIRVLAYCCLALPATAQTSFAEMHLKGHPTLYVTETDGRETRGKLLTVGDAAITLQLKNSTRTFTPEQLALIERKGDSLKNGVVAGMVIAAVCMLTCAQGVSSGGQLAKVAFVNALFPVAIDAANVGRTRIWPPAEKGRR